jgi:hypothetical protein
MALAIAQSYYTYPHNTVGQHSPSTAGYQIWIVERATNAVLSTYATIRHRTATAHCTVTDT